MWLGILSALLACALWGFAFLAPKLLLDFSPVLVAVGRYVVYAAFALIVCLPHLRTTLSFARGPHGRAAFGLSLMSNTVYFWLMSSAVQMCGAAVTGVVIGTIPVWVSLLGRTKDVPLKRLTVPLLCIVTGICLINYQVLSTLTANNSLTFYLGLFCAMLATVCWTTYAYLNALYLQKHRDIKNFDWTNLLAFSAAAPLPFLIPLFVWANPESIEHTADSWRTFIWVSLVLGIGASWVAAYLWNTASKVLPTTLAGQMIIAETVFVLIYDFLYDQRWPTAIEYTAIFLCCFGILTAIRLFSSPKISE